jgi:hypothetical protein
MLGAITGGLVPCRYHFVAERRELPREPTKIHSQPIREKTRGDRCFCRANGDNRKRMDRPMLSEKCQYFLIFCNSIRFRNQNIVY